MPTTVAVFALVERAVLAFGALTLLLVSEEVTLFDLTFGVDIAVFGAVGNTVASFCDAVVPTPEPPIVFDTVGLSSVRSFKVFHPLPPAPE